MHSYRSDPCVVTQIKTKAVDGYDAIQPAFDDKKKTQQMH